jgi:hypothetical protein
MAGYISPIRAKRSDFEGNSASEPLGRVGGNELNLLDMAANVHT